MTNRLWIFPAILCLLCAVTFIEGLSIIGMLLLIFWLIRIYLLQNRSILLLSMSITCLFLINVFQHQMRNQTILSEEQTAFIIYPEVTSIKIDGNSLRFNGLVEGEKGQEEVVVTYRIEHESEQKEWLNTPPQKYLLVTGELTEPSIHRNFHQFNYRNYLRRESIHWIFEAKNIQVLEDEPIKKPLSYKVEGIRYEIFHYIDKTFDWKIASYLKTLLFADKRQFPEEVLQTYQVLGVIHLFSISGFHISYLIQLVRRFLLRIGLTHEHSTLILLLILPIYGWLAGMGVSVFRAVTQNMLVLSSKAMNKQMDTIDAWAVTMMLALFIHPYQIYHISFQLSYTLSGIFILMGKHKWIQELNPITYSLLFSFMSGLASLPILTYHFYEFSWVTLLANLLFIPLFSNILFPFLLLIFGGSFLINHTRAFKLTEQLLIILIQFTESLTLLLSETFNFSLVTGRLPEILLVLLVISVFIVLKRLESKKFPQIRYLLLIAFCLFFNRYSPIGHITMLDVGQGDAILLKAPYGRGVFLIDTGGRLEWSQGEEWMQRATPYTVGKDIIVPSLKAFGIAAIDCIYITHADADHSGEILNIGQRMPIKEVAATEATLKDDLVKNQLLNMENTNLWLVQPPERLELPDANTFAIYPTRSFTNASKNDQSLVLYGTIGEDNWLFTGDIEKAGEKQLLKDFPDLRTDYLKVSHHGSQTSSSQAFIERIQPKTALISAGIDNSFGHPHEDVLNNLNKKQVEVYLTSETGAVSVRYLFIPVLNIWLSDVQTVHEVN